jgi:hypothetical protein
VAAGFRVSLQDSAHPDAVDLDALDEPAHFIMERKMLKTIDQRARRGSAP